MTDQANMAYGVAGEKRYYSIGDTIARMGDPADGFYILLTGKIEVYKKDFTVAEINTRGTIFGELGTILNKPLNRHQYFSSGCRWTSSSQSILSLQEDF
jgi:CRP-like cAMP-binding protein